MESEMRHFLTGKFGKHMIHLTSFILLFAKYILTITSLQVRHPILRYSYYLLWLLPIIVNFFTWYWVPFTRYLVPFTNYRIPFTHHPLPFTFLPFVYLFTWERLEKLRWTALRERRMVGDLIETNGISYHGRDFSIFLLKLEISSQSRFQKLSQLKGLFLV